MAGFDYGKMANTATRLLDRFKQGTVALTVPGVVMPGTNPWDAPIESDPTTYTLKATVAAVGDEYVNGTTILATDDMVTAAPFGYEPEPGDVLSVDGNPVTIVKQMRVPSAGVLVAWKWIVRS